MAIIENIINVIVPLLICGLIFIYFRRRITNLEQSIDIIMKMIQTNNSKDSDTMENVYVPSSTTESENVKKIEMGVNNIQESNEDSDESDDSDSETGVESESESDSDSDSESNTETEENTNQLETIAEEEENVMKTVKLGEEEELTKDELEKKNVVELKKMLKEKSPTINNLSRMKKDEVIENLMN